MHLDAPLTGAIAAGRDIIVPDRHRAAALRLAWARQQQQRGATVWPTPSIHTWDAWLTRQWRAAVQRGAAPAAQLLGSAQERALWEAALQQLEGGQGGEFAPGVHAAALMEAAARATQSQLLPLRTAQSREEQLLVAALAEVQRHCAARGLLSLRLVPAAQLGFLADVPPPLIVGVPRLSALQEALAARLWPGARLLAPLPAGQPTGSVQLLRAAELEQEIAACVAWCRQHVQRDPAARLLVLSACGDPSLAIQAQLLWRALAPDGGTDDAARERWLAVEGGEPLLHQGLIADALRALGLADAGTAIDTADLLALLRSPVFDFGSAAETVALADWLADTGLARWERPGLADALRQAARTRPAAARLGDWLATQVAALPMRERVDATTWATRFSDVLAAAGFADSGQLDSRNLQRLGRWHELLDELAGLDAVLPPMPLGEALAQLRRLAAQARHQAASADAAITLSDSLADPVAGHDGIWVLGLTESRWPAPPRPDPWVPLFEQRRAHWPAAGVSERRAQAEWALGCWRWRTTDLVVSYPAREGDLTHRPPPLLAALAPEPLSGEPAVLLPRLGAALAASDQQLRPCLPASASTVTEPVSTDPVAGPDEAVITLAGGAGLLATQQQCAFRAQARWRLGATPPVSLHVGIPPLLRGRLLHGVLQTLWLRLRDQAGLLSCAPSTLDELLQHCWAHAVGSTRGAAWLAPAVLERERTRTLALVHKVLELERQRAPFSVIECERKVQWQAAGARLGLRIDRIDRVAGQAVLIDYKSGAAERCELQHGVLQPLQLALYAAALAQQGEAIGAAALLGLNPAEPAFSGAGAAAGLLPGGLQPVEDWQTVQRQWQVQLLQLMQQHLSGAASLAQDSRVCAGCHLPALCRRAGPEALEPEDA